MRSGVFRAAEKFCTAGFDGGLERRNAASAESVLVSFDAFLDELGWITLDGSPFFD